MAAVHPKNAESKNMKNFFVSCLESRIENPTTYYGSFQIGPFPKGQGITLANALRRTILSEIPGLGILSAKLQTITNGSSYVLNSTETEIKTLEGAEPDVRPILHLEQFSEPSRLNYAAHEYSILEGVRESTLDILLNLREVVLTSNTFFQTTQIAFLEIQGPGNVFSGDLRLPSGLKVVDPNQYIATLTTNVTLQAKIFISFGKKDQAFNAPIKTEPGILHLEPTFFPIKKVNYKIELDQIYPQHELIIFEIWTNGSLHPRKALEKGIVTLIQIFSKIQKNLNLLDSLLPSIFDDFTFLDLTKKVKSSNLLNATKTEFKDYYPKKWLDINLATERRSVSENNESNLIQSHSTFPQTSYPQTNESLTQAQTPSSQAYSMRILKDVNPNPSNNFFVENFLLLPIRKRLARLDIGNLNLSLSLYTYLKGFKIDSIQDLIVNYKKIQKQLRIKNPNLVEELETILKPVGLNFDSDLTKN